MSHVSVSKKFQPGGIREMTSVAFPMGVSLACDTVMTFTDRLFLAHLGPDHMNAALGGGLSVFVMSTFFLGLTGYATALVAQYFGSGQIKKCALTTTQALIIAVAAYPLLILIGSFVPQLFKLANLTPTQLNYQTVYFRILLYAICVSLFRSSLSSFFSGIGKTSIVMVASLLSMVTNIALNYILIFGKLGFPALGIRGAAYGTIIGGICGVLVLFGAYLSPKNNSIYHVWHSFRFDWTPMKKLLRFGYPTGVEMFMNLLAFNLMIMIFHAQGSAVATAATIVINWDMVSFVPLIGVEIGVTSLVGRYMGARNPDLAHRATMSGIKMGLVYSSCVFVLFVFLPSHLVGLFQPTNSSSVFREAYPLAVFMIRAASLYVMVETFLVCFIGALRGAGDTFWAMIFSVSMHWVLVPVLFILLNVFHLSPQVGWLAIIILFLCFSSLVYFRYRSGKWKKIKVVSPKTEIPPEIALDFHETRDL